MKEEAAVGTGAGAPLVGPSLVVCGEGMESAFVPDPLKTGLNVVTAGAGPAGAPGGGSFESNLPNLGDAAALEVGLVHSGGAQDDNSSETSQLKDPPPELQAMSDWWDKRDWGEFQNRVIASKKVTHRAPGPNNTKTAMGGTFSSPNRELMADLRRFQSEQSRLGVLHRKSVQLMEPSEEVEEASGEEEGKEESEVEVTVLEGEGEDSVGEEGE